MSHHFKSPRATPSYLSVRVNEERNKILSLQLLLKRENSFYQFWKHVILFRLQDHTQLMHPHTHFQVLELALGLHAEVGP